MKFFCPTLFFFLLFFIGCAKGVTCPSCKRLILVPSANPSNCVSEVIVYAPKYRLDHSNFKPRYLTNDIAALVCDKGNNNRKSVFDFLPLFVALLAGVFALHQVRKNAVSGARIKWIESLRDLISQYISFSRSVVLDLKLERTYLENKLQAKFDESFEKSRERIFNLETIKYKIKLHLSKKSGKSNALQVKLATLIDKHSAAAWAVVEAKESNISEEKMREAVEEIVLTSAELLENEWGRINRLF